MRVVLVLAAALLIALPAGSERLQPAVQPALSVPASAGVSRGGATRDVLGVRAPQPDHGPGAEVAAVRGAVTDLLTADAAAAARAVSDHPDQRALALEAVWTADDVPRRLDAGAVTAQPAAGSASAHVGTDYDTARFVVGDWQGVDVAGDRATATVRGHVRYRSGSRSWDGPERQYWVELVRVDTIAAPAWRLVTARPTDGDTPGCCSPDPVLGPIAPATPG